MLTKETEIQILTQLNEAANEGLRRGLIILRGPFQSGKTTLLKKFMDQQQLNEKKCCLNLNLFLLEKLKKEIEHQPELNLQVLSRLKAKTSNFFKGYIENYFSQFLAGNNLLIIDAVEILLNYPINLPQIALPFFGERKTIIIAVPFDEKNSVHFHWSYNLAKVIDL